MVDNIIVIGTFIQQTRFLFHFLRARNPIIIRQVKVSKLNMGFVFALSSHLTFFLCRKTFKVSRNAMKKKSIDFYT
jgi:hypothetical protein